MDDKPARKKLEDTGKHHIASDGSVLRTCQEPVDIGKNHTNGGQGGGKLARGII